MTILTLISESPERLLPTILSRVQTIKFYPVKKQEIRDYLKTQGIAEKESQEISEISLGSPGLAIDFISNHQKLAERQAILKQLNKILNSDLAYRFELAKELSADQDELRQTLKTWLLHFREVLLSQPSDKEVLIKLKNIEETIFLISSTNVNSRLALENLMLKL